MSTAWIVTGHIEETNFTQQDEEWNEKTVVERAGGVWRRNERERVARQRERARETETALLGDKSSKG